MSEDDLARLMRGLGFGWSRDQVARIKRGQRKLNLPELIALASTFGVRSLADLVATAGDDSSELAAGATVSRAALRGFLSGHAPAPVLVAPQGTAPAVHQARVSARRGRLSVVDEDARSLAVQHAARQLGVSAPEIAALARKRYGRDLVSERDARVQARLTAGEEQDEALDPGAVRGRAMREILAELRAPDEL